MSGGRFDYRNDMLCEDIFNGLCSEYGIGEDENQIINAKETRKVNPFEDSLISELVYDVFCLIRSLDYYRSYDTSEDTYRKDVDAFKSKWLKISDKKLAERTVTNNIKDLEERLRRELMVEKLY